MLKRYHRQSFIAVVVLILNVLAAGARGDTPAANLAFYFDLVVSGNLESAKLMWAEPVRERAYRFDIEFEGIRMKVDCASPVIRDLDLMKHFLERPAKMQLGLQERHWKVQYSNLVLGNLVEHDYYMVRNGDYFLLTMPQDYFARNWPVVTSRYFRIHHEPERKIDLNPLVLEQADRYVERLADSLALDDATHKLLADAKIEYFYCADDKMVDTITGQKTKGLLDLGSNDIISAFFPHYHELVHLMVNIKLKRIPLYTLPIMREGVAVYFGGRWGKAPMPIMAFGGYLLKHDMLTVDSILTMRGFGETIGADLAYPVAGLFCGFVRSTAGPEKFWELYRRFSGSFDTVNGFTIETARNEILAVTGHKDWQQFESEFNRYVGHMMEDRADMAPGGKERGRQLVALPGAMVLLDGDWVQISCAFEDSSEARGNLLFGFDSVLANARSELFDDQYRGSRQFAGYRFGIRYDFNEAGLYDYAANQLVAKYIRGVNPAEGYLDAEAGRVRFRIRKEAFDGILPDSTRAVLLPE